LHIIDQVKLQLNKLMRRQD